MQLSLAEILEVVAVVALVTVVIGVISRGRSRRARDVVTAGVDLDESVPWSAPPTSGDSYRTRPTGAGPRWDPFAADQSREQRVRAARRRARSAPVVESPAGPLGAACGLLGVPANASEREIEKAYRRHVAAIHPDRFHGDPRRQEQAETKLKQLNAAVALLRKARGS